MEPLNCEGVIFCRAKANTDIGNVIKKPTKNIHKSTNDNEKKYTSVKK